MFDLPQSGGQAAETRADIPLWALLQTSALKRFLRWWFDFINSRDKTFFFFHFKLNQRITETHIFMRILWGKNIPLDSITNQRATLDLCRAARWSFGEKYILYKPFTNFDAHAACHTRASPPGLDFFDRSGSLDLFRLRSSWENECYLHENEKSFLNQTLRGTWKWSVANYKPWIIVIKMPTKFPMTLSNIRS